MKLSELIAAAQEKLEEFGDLECWYPGWQGYERIEEIELVDVEGPLFVEFK